MSVIGNIVVVIVKVRILGRVQIIQIGKAEYHQDHLLVSHIKNGDGKYLQEITIFVKNVGIVVAKY